MWVSALTKFNFTDNLTDTSLSQCFCSFKSFHHVARRQLLAIIVERTARDNVHKPFGWRFVMREISDWMPLSGNWTPDTRNHRQYFCPSHPDSGQNRMADT